MSKSAVSTPLLVLVLLVCAALTRAARPAPELAHQQAGVAREASRTTATAMVEARDDLCDGVGEDECGMMRRELAAHLDYIYTQKKKN